MKKYFNSVDLIVMFFSLMCLLWIVLYKLFWIDAEPLFINADRYADITYTVFASLLAAGFFYIVTIFLPKLKQIKEMKKGLIFYLDMIDDLNNSIFSKIKVGNTNTFFTASTLRLKYIKNQKKAEDDFNTIWNNKVLFPLLNYIMNKQNDYIIGIMSNYSNILTRELQKEIRDHINIYSNKLKSLPDTTTLSDQTKGSLSVIIHTTGLVIGIRETYKINNENIQ